MRQGEINKGFDVLRERIPHPVLSKGRCEKLRKIDILHVAISYIRALENILESGDAGINEFANSLYSVVSPSCSLAAEAAAAAASAGGGTSPAWEAKTLEAGPSSPQTPDSCLPGENSCSPSSSPAKTAFCKIEEDLAPPSVGSAQLEKRRQKVLFQTRPFCNTG